MSRYQAVIQSASLALSPRLAGHEANPPQSPAVIANAVSPAPVAGASGTLYRCVCGEYHDSMTEAVLHGLLA